jgi:hypothetical protein
MKIYELTEAPRGFAPTNLFQDLCIDFSTFISMNMTKINQYAKDEQSKAGIDEMTKQLRQPAVNGIEFTQAYSDPKITKSPAGRGALMKYIYNSLVYIEPRLKKFLNDQGQQMFLPRLDKIKQQYTTLVQKQ